MLVGVDDYFSIKLRDSRLLINAAVTIDMTPFDRFLLLMTSQFPFAIFYFTGPDHFNRAIRNHASHLGYSLSDVVSTAERTYYLMGISLCGIIPNIPSLQ
jgi:DNA polymerase beta thumb